MREELLAQGQQADGNREPPEATLITVAQATQSRQCLRPFWARRWQ